MQAKKSYSMVLDVFDKIPIESPMDNQLMNADLVMGNQNQHRDLFTGSVGLPNTSTHVGSVVHAFETMAMKRQVVEPKQVLRNNPGAPLILASTLPIQKRDKKYTKNLPKRIAPGSKLHKITLAEQTHDNPMSHLATSAQKLDDDQRSEYETNFMGDYRKNLFQGSTLEHKRELFNDLSNSNDEDQLIRGTMVSRSFIKNVRKPKKVADDSSSKSFSKGQMVPTRDTDTTEKDYMRFNASQNLVAGSRNPFFRPKPADRAIL